jgi:hypothetical protein
VINPSVDLAQDFSCLEESVGKSVLTRALPMAGRRLAFVSFFGN